MQKLLLHNELYSAKAIRQALSEFTSYANVVMNEKMPYYEIIIKAHGEYRDAEAAGEFANYALALTVEEKS